MRTLARFIAATVVLIPALAWAGGMEFPDNGAQALSRGGAFSAKADDLTALEYNVAGLAKKRGTRLMLSLNLVNADATFQRAGVYPTNAGSPQPYDGQPFPSVSNSGGPFLAPFIVAASDFGLNKWTFAAGVYGPSSYGTLKFPRTVQINDVTAPAPQRYDFIDSDLLVAYPTFAVAYKPLDMISVGAAFHWVYMHSQFHQTSYVPPADPNLKELPLQDYDTNLDVTDSFTPSFSVGALARPTEHLEVGVNYRYKTEMDASGTVVATSQPGASITPMYDNGKNAVVTDFKTTLPQVLRGGVRYIWTAGDVERGDIEADFTYEGWSVVGDPALPGDITIATSGVNPQPKLVRSPHRYNDSWSARLGGQYNWDTLLGTWSGRLGFFYDAASAPDEWTRLDFRAWDHIGYTAGVGWQWGGLSANLGGAYIYMPERNVTNSQLCQTATLGGSPTACLTPSSGFTDVGNGKYTAGYTIVTFSLEYKFDPFR